MGRTVGEPVASILQSMQRQPAHFTSGTVQRMRSNKEWRRWGKEDPLYAVATWTGRERSGPNAWTSQDFLALGRQDLSDVMRHWDHYGRMVTGECIEIGCGSGRMTSALLDYFDQVYAIDVSPDQIVMAKELLGPRQTRVRFSVVDSPAIAVRPGSCSAMFTSHVFQHLSERREAVREYLTLTHRALLPGASICFHLPVPGAHRLPDETSWRRIKKRVRYAVQRLLHRDGLMEYNVFPVRAIFDMLEVIGYVDAELRILPMTSNGDPHSYFFARKPS